MDVTELLYLFSSWMYHLYMWTLLQSTASHHLHHPLKTHPLKIDDNEDDHFDSAGILTQFIGPRIMTTSNSSTEDDEDTTRVAKEIESLKRQYLDSTQVLDRATNHLKSLHSAQSDQRTPNKLK